VAEEVLQDRVLLGRELDELTGAKNLPGVSPQLEVGNLERGRRNGTWAPGERLDPREELLEREGLRDIVVGTCAKCRDLGVDRVLRGENEHGSLESLGSQGVEDFEAGLSRQTHVQNDEIIRFGARAALAILPVRDEVDRPAMLFQSALHVLPYGWIIFDDEDSHPWLIAISGAKKKRRSSR
jgi:hypothetical protein